MLVGKTTSSCARARNDEAQKNLVEQEEVKTDEVEKERETDKKERGEREREWRVESGKIRRR